MRALVVIALLAGTAHAEGEDRDSLLDDLKRSVRYPGKTCRTHLDKLRSLGVPESTTIEFFLDGHFVRRGTYSLAELRPVCEAVMHASDVADIKEAIVKATKFPWVWAEECLKRWPKALAAGVKPTERIDVQTGSRRGRITISGTLEQAYTKYCENAYTPRRRGE